MLLLFPSARVCSVPLPKHSAINCQVRELQSRAKAASVSPVTTRDWGAGDLLGQKQVLPSIIDTAPAYGRKEKTRRACVFPSSRDREVSSNLLTLLTRLPHRVESFLVTCGSASQAFKYCSQRHGDNGGTCFSS